MCVLSGKCIETFDVTIVKQTWPSEALTSEESGSTDNISASDHQKFEVLSEIFSAEPANTAYHAFFWKVKDEIHLQDKVIQLIKTSWFGIVSKYILNQGYRIIVTFDHQTKILAQERNDSEGKRRIQDRWKAVQALQKAYLVLKCPNCTQETGHFQAEVMVAETNEVPIHDLSLCHFQNVYYVNVTPFSLLNPELSTPTNSFQTGMAQCTVSAAQLKEMKMPSKRFLLKLWPSSSALQTSINYLNEIELHKFKEMLNESSCHNQPEILVYIPCSSNSSNDNLVAASQLAVDLGFTGKIVLFEWGTEKVKPQQLLLEFLNMLCSLSTKVHIIAVSDAAHLLVKSLTRFEHKLGQVILTKLRRLSRQIFDGLQEMEQKSNSLLFQADNITIYHKPEPCQPLMHSFSISSNQNKKCPLEPPPFIPYVDIICLESIPDFYQLKSRVNKLVLEDMSEIICNGKSVADRALTVKLQCACKKLKPPIYRSHLPCTICSCCSYFVIGYIEGLPTCTPAFLEEIEYNLHEHECDVKEKRLCVHKKMQLEGMLCHQYYNNSRFITKSAAW